MSSTTLNCVLPWKALFMDELNSEIAALPCCLSWSKLNYGQIRSGSLLGLWNSEGAQRIRYLISEGHQNEVCSKNCPHFDIGTYSESKLRVIEGPTEFVSNQVINNEEIRMRKTILRSKPILFKIIPTLECNLRCKMCFQNSFHKLDYSPRLWQEIRQFFPYAHEITFQGGEVTIMPEFQKFLNSTELQNNSNVNINIITNGTNLDDNFFNLIKKLTINQITVSLNAATRETYYKITRTQLFDKVLENIQRLNLISKTHTIKSFSLVLSFIVMKSNFNEIPKFISLSEHYNSQIQLLPMFGNRGNENIAFNSDFYNKLRTVLKKTAINCSISTYEQIKMIENVFDKILD